MKPRRDSRAFHVTKALAHLAAVVVTLSCGGKAIPNTSEGAMDSDAGAGGTSPGGGAGATTAPDGSAEGTAYVTGTIIHGPLAAVDAIASFRGRSSTRGSPSVEVLITNVPGACALEGQSVGPAHSAVLNLEMLFNSPMAYQFNALASVNLVPSAYYSTFSTCTSTMDSADSGTILLTRVDPTVVEGSFDLTFDGTDHLVGSFSAPVCDTPLGDLAQGFPMPLCQADSCPPKGCTIGP
ncbi:MAG: hypothetical protein ACREJ3_12860 [Polyangiaceae bacterium]